MADKKVLEDFKANAKNLAVDLEKELAPVVDGAKQVAADISRELGHPTKINRPCDECKAEGRDLPATSDHMHGADRVFLCAKHATGHVHPKA